MELWNDFLSLLEHLVRNENMLRLSGSVFIVLLALAIRKLIAKSISLLLKKFASKTKTQLDDRLLSAIEPPVRFIVVIAGITAALWLIGLKNGAAVLARHITNSLFAFAFFWAAYRVANGMLAFFKEYAKKTESKIDDMLLPFLFNGIKVIIVILGAVTIIQEWYSNITGLLAGLGLGGLAFALAAQDTVSNLFGSITIMLDRPFAIGDWIKTPNVEGIVEYIGFRSTRVRTFAQALVTVPNSIMSKDPITNWSRMGKRRISFTLRIKYGVTSAELNECLKEIREMLENHPDVHPETIFVHFENFGENSLEIMMYFFTKTTVWKEYLEAREDINFKIMDILERRGLSVALPSRSIYFETTIQGN